jgi:hypothetical protein
VTKENGCFLKLLASITLMVEAVSSSKTSISNYQTTGATFQKTAIFILVAVKILYFAQ